MNKLPADTVWRILIIDDNQAIHEDFRKILAPANASTPALDATEAAVFGDHMGGVPETRFEVDSAFQGEEGVEMVRKAIADGRPYGMAFVDVRMPPGIDGVETTRRIWEADPHLQVVLCTAYSDYSWSEVFEKLCRRDGLIILKKPFDSVEASQLANALTEKWWLHQQSRQTTEDLEGRVTGRTRELREANEALQAEVAERKRAEDQVRLNAALLEAQINSSLDGILIVDENRKTLLQNRRFVDLFKIPSNLVDEVSDENRLQWVMDSVKNPEPFLEKILHLYAHPDETSRDEVELKDGTTLDRYSFPAIGKDGVCHGRVWAFRDITQRKKIEAQLLQSQRMETVGRLAGGVAHEFNSILTAILGQSELLLRELPPEGSTARSAGEINKAASRAATLTRQLLAHGRKQILQPETLDLNRVIAGMEGIFHHIMGHDVEMQMVPWPGLKAVLADAGQIEQLILNMAINARDAMPNGGKLTLETANVSFDSESVGRYPELRPGDYVMLAISDTGAGMSEDVKARAFEPFFSTKPAGQGTGLGLSTCYGIAKQSGGHISVYSETGRGATFKIYLPQVQTRAEPPPAPPLGTRDLPPGVETILLVEDDPALREMAGTLLRRLGYTVLTAANGIEALSLKHNRETGHVDLLFTDVVMPHMSGKELADRVKSLYPHTRVLFTSAYTENAIVHQGVLNKGVALLQKPYTPAALARKLREVLDQPATPEPAAAAVSAGFTEFSNTAVPRSN